MILIKCLAVGDERGEEIISSAQAPKWNIQDKLTHDEFDLGEEGWSLGHSVMVYPLGGSNVRPDRFGVS